MQTLFTMYIIYVSETKDTGQNEGNCTTKLLRSNIYTRTWWTAVTKSSQMPHVYSSTLLLSWVTYCKCVNPRQVESLTASVWIQGKSSHLLQVCESKAWLIFVLVSKHRQTMNASSKLHSTQRHRPIVVFNIKLTVKLYVLVTPAKSSSS